MKRRSHLVLGLGLLVAAGACACAKGDPPKVVAQKIYAAIKAGDAKALEGLVTKDSLPALSKVAHVTKFLPAGDATFGNEQVSGDSATVPVKIGGIETPWGLKKEDGKWKGDMKVTFDKMLSGGVKAGIEKVVGAGIEKLKGLFRPSDAPQPADAPPRAAEPPRAPEPPRAADAPRPSGP